MALAMPNVKETWKGAILEVTLGATPDQGGTRKQTVTIGGETTLPFAHFEGAMPHRPVVAVEVMDRTPDEWPPPLLEAWGDAVRDPALWAAKAEELGADLIYLILDSAHPERGDTAPDRARATVRAVLDATGLPLMIIGPGQAEKDNEVLVAAAEEAAGERVVLGNCEDKNYRTIVAAALANDHLVVACTPIDVNLAKQLNVLITDMRLDLDRIVMDPTTGALGYGIEYTYSVMERLRIAALSGDKVLQLPMVVLAGFEAWRAKETRTDEGVPAGWGDWDRRAVLWEANTATTLLQSGADVVTMRHPRAIGLIKRAIDELMEPPA
jgi:acetyl-CoA decarbonylase/synthase, CODH/ACS complex subunit delta